ncbi:MAG: hypothetical protein KTR22_03900 [Flavobacteriaceae bacterium]|nr:hypothetical protein [Flavobacteriaceae bacterium]
MGVGVLQKNYKVIITLIGIVFLLVSIYIHTTDNFVLYRLIRGIIIFFFLGLLLYYQSSRWDKVLILFLLLYGSSSILTIWYENTTCATGSMVLSFLSYLVLIASLIPKVKFREMNALFLIAFIILVGVNAYLLYELILLIKDFALSKLHYSFILLGAMSLAVVGFLALMFNHRYSSKTTLMYTFFVFLLIFSEVFRAIGYYDIAYGDVSVYIARGLLIAALSMLLNHVVANKKSNKQIGVN